MKLTLPELNQLVVDILLVHQVHQAQAQSIANNLITAQQDNAYSHGVWRILELVQTIKNKQLNPTPVPEVTLNEGAVIKVNADHGASSYAFEFIFDDFVKKVKEQGIALLAINHCIHFTALWVEIEQLINHQLVAFNMTPSHAWVAPAGGQSPLLGTNPFAFGWPRLNNQQPFVFDFATSAVARGEIQLRMRNKQTIPKGWGLDKTGEVTTDPKQVLEGAMLTFGGHKGSLIATMIELLAGPLIGDLTSQQSMDYTNETAALPYGGELIIAIDPHKLLANDFDQYFQNAEQFFEAYQNTGARLPSSKRFQAREINQKNGYCEIDDSLYEDLLALKSN